MSDFDKEAEREKLREKYEHDQDKRQDTEQMSELLLKGATMTNAHCSECSDPIFRYDGQEFCPTCEKAVERDTAGDADGAAADEDAAEQRSIEVTDPSEGARVAFGADADQSASGDSGASADTAAGARERADGQERAREQPGDRHGQSDSTARHTQAPQSGRPSGESQSGRPPRREPERNRQAPRPTHGDDIAAARESLVRALARFSEAAAATDDPRQATDHLAAAREAAEALAALDR